MATDSASPDAAPSNAPLVGLPQGPSEAAVAASAFESLQHELAALRQAHQELQAVLAEERQIHEMIREERDEYRQIIYPPLRNLVPEEELIRFAETAHLQPMKPLRDLLVEMGVYENERGE